jgi:hypothetical protein
MRRTCRTAPSVTEGLRHDSSGYHSRSRGPAVLFRARRIGIGSEGASAKRALTGFVAACATGEDESLRKLTTDDIRIEYALDEPGTFLNVDASSGTVGCGALNGPDGRLENLWILPTDDASSVFVQYDTGEGRQLALIEMRNERIARVVNFASAPQALLASAVAAQSTGMPCVRLSERK